MRTPPDLRGFRLAVVVLTASIVGLSGCSAEGADAALEVDEAVSLAVVQDLADAALRHDLKGICAVSVRELDACVGSLDANELDDKLPEGSEIQVRCLRELSMPEDPVPHSLALLRVTMPDGDVLDSEVALRKRDGETRVVFVDFWNELRWVNNGLASSTPGPSTGCSSNDVP